MPTLTWVSIPLRAWLLTWRARIGREIVEPLVPILCPEVHPPSKVLLQIEATEMRTPSEPGRTAVGEEAARGPWLIPSAGQTPAPL